MGRWSEDLVDVEVWPRLRSVMVLEPPRTATGGVREGERAGRFGPDRRRRLSAAIILVSRR